MQDCPNYEAVGGITRDLLKSLGEDPLEVRMSFQALIKEHEIPVIFEHRVSLVHVTNAEIQSIDLDYAPPDATGTPIVEPQSINAMSVKAKVFIDASYEGPTRKPYPISYRMITPKSSECTNLLVPVCFSAIHLGYASARMEPVFMVVGKYAGEAAALAIKNDVAVQDIDMSQLLDRLDEIDQRLSWPIE